jgi:hypothetical protein
MAGKAVFDPFRRQPVAAPSGRPMPTPLSTPSHPAMVAAAPPAPTPAPSASTYAPPGMIRSAGGSIIPDPYKRADLSQEQKDLAAGYNGLTNTYIPPPEMSTPEPAPTPPPAGPGPAAAAAPSLTALGTPGAASAPSLDALLATSAAAPAGVPLPSSAPKLRAPIGVRQPPALHALLAQMAQMGGRVY